jgi:trans-2,3-dihydro-3-hydroxyanthranilate isomerase
VTLAYHRVDVFAPQPYAGNSLPVFLDAAGLSAGQMLAITREMRCFEAVFLEPGTTPGRVRARVFDLFEELPFAGHPLLGAAAVLHRIEGPASGRTWQLELADRTVEAATAPDGRAVRATLDQGAPDFLGRVHDRGAIAAAFSLRPTDLDSALPLEVVSTGLRYLIVPVAPGALTHAAVAGDLTSLLAGVGAQFAVLLDEAALEIRHWNNDGILEDVATGSAAGTIGAYRLAHGLAAAGETFQLQQGRFVGRPSVLHVQPTGAAARVERVKVGGAVSFVGRGWLEVLP